MCDSFRSYRKQLSVGKHIPCMVEIRRTTCSVPNSSTSLCMGTKACFPSETQVLHGFATPSIPNIHDFPMVFVSKTTPGGRNWVPPTLQQPLGPSPPVSSGGEPPFLLQSGGYHLVNIQKTVERSTQSPIDSWEKPRFRLGHFPCRFLHVYQSVSRHRSLGPFNLLSIGPVALGRHQNKAVKQVLLPPLWMYLLGGSSHLVNGL